LPAREAALRGTRPVPADAARRHVPTEGNHMQQQPESEQTSQEEEIRRRAYYLWEHADEPKGTPEEYWERARAEIEKEAPPIESGPIAEEPKK
jgi:hypothetical protein